MKGFFVTGTGTEVGKTVVSAAVIGALRSMGLRVCAMKPVESGCDGTPPDGTFLREASGVDEPIDMITPFMFKAPLAPLSAARLEGREVDTDLILSMARELASRYEAIVVEGAGGFLVPVAEDGYLVRDMARELGMPVIVAASPYLGTVNHTLLTLEAIEGAGLRPAGVVLNHISPSPGDMGGDMVGDMAGQSSRELIEEHTDMPLLGQLPYMEGAPLKEILDAGANSLRLDMLRKFL